VSSDCGSRLFLLRNLQLVRGLTALLVYAGPHYVLHILHVQAHEAAALPGGAGAAAFAYETDDALNEEQVLVFRTIPLSLNSVEAALVPLTCICLINQTACYQGRHCKPWSKAFVALFSIPCRGCLILLPL